MPERMLLQGKDPFIAAHLGDFTLACKASGNAYPPPLICAALVPILQAVAASGMDLDATTYPGMDFEKETRRAMRLIKARKRPVKKLKGFKLFS